MDYTDILQFNNWRINGLRHKNASTGPEQNIARHKQQAAARQIKYSEDMDSESIITNSSGVPIRSKRKMPRS